MKWTARPELSARNLIKAIRASNTPGIAFLPALGECILTHGGRTALEILFRHLAVENSEVLLPSYNCGSEIEGVRAAGCMTSFYRIDANARIDRRDLEQRISPKTRAILVTHFFGFPSDVEWVAQLCSQRSLLLIEDCCHALFSAHRGQPLGSFGDAAVFSFTKSLPLPDGGALATRPGLIGGKTQLKPAPLGRVLLRTVDLGAASIVNRLRWGALTALARSVTQSRAAAGLEEGPSLPRLTDSYRFKSALRDRRFSWLGMRLLPLVTTDSVAQTRRHNYQTLHQAVAELESLRPLFPELPDGTCPLWYPVVADDRPWWTKALIRRGVQVFPWWSRFHEVVPWQEFADARRLKQTVLALPIGQQMTPSEVGQVAELLCKLQQQSRRASGLLVTSDKIRGNGRR